MTAYAARPSSRIATDQKRPRPEVGAFILLRFETASTDISDIAGQNDDIAVRVSYPALPMVRSRVYIGSFDDVRAKRARLLYRNIKRAQLEPEQHTKTVGRRGWLAKVRMAMNVPGMKLEDHFAILHNLFVFVAAMTALAPKQLLVPAAAALYIAHGDQRLSFHIIGLV
jgi:hypothetical protein